MPYVIFISEKTNPSRKGWGQDISLRKTENTNTRTLARAATPANIPRRRKNTPPREQNIKGWLKVWSWQGYLTMPYDIMQIASYTFLLKSKKKLSNRKQNKDIPTWTTKATAPLSVTRPVLWERCSICRCVLVRLCSRAGNLLYRY